MSLAIVFMFVFWSFGFGALLREYTLPRRHDVSAWIPPALALVIAIGCGIAVYHGQSWVFLLPLVTAALIGFFWLSLNRFAERWVLPRLRPYTPYVILATLFALGAAFATKNTFFLSAFVAGTLFVLLGGLIKYALRLTK